MLTKETIEEKLKTNISNEKYKEILNLPYQSLARVRTNPTGQIFHRLLVLGRAPSDIMAGGKPISKWWCICNCSEHNIISVRINNLTSGNTKSCGCWCIEQSTSRIKEIGHRLASNLTGQRFTKLLAIRPTDIRKNGSVVWECKCDCGNTFYARATELKRGSVGSCGCLTESKGSFKIKQILNNSNEIYLTEIEFKTCIFPDSLAPARFDFYLPDKNILIEYDGEQHFLKYDKNYFKDDLYTRQQHDIFKNQWCLKNHYLLYRIPYTDINQINTLNDILQDKYLLKEDNI